MEGLSKIVMSLTQLTKKRWNFCVDRKMWE